MRRWFVSLAAMGLLAGVALAAEQRTYAAGSFAWTLDGAPGGFVKSFEGGNIVGEVVQDPVGPSGITAKHVGKPKYEAGTLQLGITQPKSVQNWLSEAMTASPSRHEIAVTPVSYSGSTAGPQRVFAQSVISEVGFPALDGSSKDTGYIVVTFTPEAIQVRPGEAKPASVDQKAKNWLQSDFRLVIDGVDCSKVASIAPFSIQHTVTTDSGGEARDLSSKPGKLVFPDLHVTISEAAADSWNEWHRDFVINGNNSQEKEKTGKIELLSRDMKTVLLRINLRGVGIYGLRSDKAEAGSEQIRRVTADLYVEQMTLEFPGGDAAAADDANAPAATPASPNPAAAPAAAPAQMPRGIRVPRL